MVRFFIVLAVLCGLSANAKAHPHAWIDLETTVVFDDAGLVKGLRVGWLFDDFYSAFSLDGVKPTQDALNILAETNLKNLSEYDYFTQITADGKKLATQKVTDYHTELRGKRLWLEFFVPLESGVDPKKSKLTYAVFDPTYYVEILHAETGDPIRLEGQAKGCGYRLTPPQPPEDISLMAAAMDQTQTAGDTIGDYFAEHVTLRCQ